MKKILAIAILLLPFIIYSQGTQEGFNYQALAVDDDGHVIKNQDLAVMVELLSAKEKGDVLYQEIHETQSSDYGVISLVIGNGIRTEGDMRDISWEEESVWVNIRFDFNLDGNFGESNYAKLLVVPYALYARTAGELTSNGGRKKSFTFPKDDFWQTDGNSRIKDGDVLGTINLVDLVVVTAGEERVRYGINGRTKHISDNEFIGSIDVLDEAIFQDSVTVGGDVDLKSKLSVTGEVDVKSNVMLRRELDVLENVRIAGSTEIIRHLDVRRDLTVDGLSYFTNTTESNTKDDGSIIIEGGVGIEKNVNIGGDITQDESTDLAELGQVIVKNTTNSTNKDDGSLVVEGGVGIEKDVFIGGSLNVVGDLVGSGLVINGARTGPDDQWSSYPVQITGSTQGVGIKITESPDSDNNFITFFDDKEKALGRIEGQTKSDILNSSDWIVETTFLSASVASAIGAVGSRITNDLVTSVDIGEIVVDFCNHALAITGATFGAIEAGGGTGDLIFVSVIAVIDLLYTLVQDIAVIGAIFVDGILSLFDLATSIAALTTYQVLVFQNAGTTFSSGSADYAEWLPKEHPSIMVTPGDVVGIYGGQITLDYEKAQNLMVISSDPMVLGNAPLYGETSENYEMVAFMGQVPVKVIGPVTKGDYLVADSNNPTFARGVSPMDLNVESCSKVVGTAWSSVASDGMNYVNASIGLSNNQVVQVLENQTHEMNQLKSELNHLKNYILQNEDILADLVPGYSKRKESLSLQLEVDVQEDFAQVDKEETLLNIQNSLHSIVNNYTSQRASNASIPLVSSQVIANVNQMGIFNDLSLVEKANSANILQDIEDEIVDILNVDVIKEFRDQLPVVVSSVVAEVKTVILDQKALILDGIINGVNNDPTNAFSADEIIMLEEKINDIIPIFEYIENSDQIVQDIISDINGIIDAVLCEICGILQGDQGISIDGTEIKMPVDVTKIRDYITIPPSFLTDMISFFNSTLPYLKENVKLEVPGIDMPDPVPNVPSISFAPFETLPTINVDIPFTNSDGSPRITFPDICSVCNN